MLSLAALRYRTVLASDGGPVEAIESGTLNLRGQQTFHANVRLTPGLTRPRSLRMYSNADGSGTHRLLSVARHIAVSEALERWAFHATTRSEGNGRFGFDADPSSNGMSAFPGLSQRSGRRTAVFQGIERFCLIGWWEGFLQGDIHPTNWPDVSAVVIKSPIGGFTAIVFAQTSGGYFVYGHAAETSVEKACTRAMVELARHEWILRSCQFAAMAGKPPEITDRFERRCWFFSTPEGHAHFLNRVRRPAKSTAPIPQVVFDGVIPGPWSRYAAVWRFVLRPPSLNFLGTDDDYFFW